MDAGYLYALMSLGSFGILGLLNKVADARNCRPSAISALACMWAAVMIFGFLVLIKHSGIDVPGKVIWVAVPFGTTVAISGIAFLAGLRYGKISTSWLVINLSAGVPAILSILIYRERVSFHKAIGLGMAIVALFLLYKDRAGDALEQPVNPSEEHSTIP
ncbi:MAG: EamA family transporter [Terriglobia bacterium]